MAGDLNFKVNFDTAQAGQQIQQLLDKFVAGSEAAGDRLNRALGGTTDKKVVIRTEVDENGVRRLTSSVVTLRSETDKLAVAYRNALKTEPGSATSLRQQINQAKAARDAIAKYGQAIDLVNRKEVFSSQQSQSWIDANTRVKQLEAAYKNLQATGDGLGSRLTGSFNQFLSVGNKLQDIVAIFQSIGIAVGAITKPIKDATNALADLQAFSLTFQSIGQTTGAAQSTLQEASRIALGLGVNIKTVREGFQQLSPVVLNSGGSLDDVSNIVEALSSRFAAFGLSADRSRRVLNGIIQAFSKGKLMAEEFTQQIAEADPAIKSDFAKALFEARSELGALGKDVDGTTANLEDLIKAGRITNDVLIKTLPLLSKSSLLFGKLGTSAGSAVDALKRGVEGVTITQVEAQIQNLNQLNLERLADIAKPLVFGLLEGQAAITDFITKISKLQITKDLIAIFVQLGEKIGQLAGFILSGTEAIIRIISVLTPFINYLLQVPGVIELIGFALIKKLVDPIGQSIKSLGQLRTQFLNLGKIKVEAPTGDPLDPRKNEVARKGLIALREELQKKVTSGPEVAVEQTTKTTKKAQKEVKKLTADIKALSQERRDILATINELEADKAQQSAADSVSKKNIQGLNAEIKALEKKKRQVETTAKELTNLYLRMETAERKRLGMPAAGAPTPMGGATDAAQVAQSIKNATADVEKINNRLQELKHDLDVLNSTDISPTIDIDGELRAARKNLADVENELKSSGKRLAKLQVGPITPKLELPISQITSAEKLIKDYKDTALRSYANIQMGSEDYVKQVRQEIAVLDDRIAKIKSARDAASAGGGASGFAVATPGGAGAQDVIRTLTNESDKLKNTLTQLEASWQRSYQGVTDYSDALSKLDDGYSLNYKEARSLAVANSVLTDALARNGIEITGLQEKESKLAAQSAQLKKELLASFEPGTTERLRGELNSTNTELEKTRGQLGEVRKAGELLKQESALVGDALDKSSKQGKGFSGISTVFKDLSKSSNGFISTFGKGGLAIGGLAKGIIGNIKAIGSAIKGLGTEVLVFAVMATVMAAYNKATETTRIQSEENEASLAGLKSVTKDLADSFDELSGKASGVKLDELVPKVSATDTVLISLGNAIKGVVDGFSNLFNILSQNPTIKATGSAVQGAANNFQKLAAALALIGTGAAVGAIFGPWGAVIGGVAGGVIALTAAFGGQGVALGEIKKKNEEIRNGYKQTGLAIRALGSEVDKYGKAVLDLQRNRAKVAAGVEQLQGSKAADAAVRDSQSQEVQLNAKLLVGYNALSKKTDELTAKRRANNDVLAEAKSRAAALQREFNVLANEQKKAESPATGKGGAPMDTKEYQDRKKRLEEIAPQLNQNIVLSQELAKNQAQLDIELAMANRLLEELRQKYGLLSPEQLKTANNMSNLEAAVKAASEALGLLDFDQQREQFNSTAQEIGKLRAEYERLENAGKSEQLVGYIRELSRQLSEGEIPNSLNNIKSLVEALENRVLYIDIESPELPATIEKLILAKQSADNLDGKKATITVEVIEKGLSDGSLKETPALLERLRGEYAKIRETSTPGSKEYEDALKREDELATRQKYNAMTIDELKNTINEKEVSRAEESSRAQEDALNRVRDKEKQAHSDKMDNLDDQKKKIEEVYDAEIKKLKELTPSEKKLDDIKTAKLKRQALGGGMKGLEARAQLERKAADEKAAKLEEQKAKEIQAIDKQREAASDLERGKDNLLADFRRKNEEQIAGIRKTAVDNELKIAKEIYTLRTGKPAPDSGGTQSSSDTPPNTSTTVRTEKTPVVMDIRTATPDDMRRDGAQDGKAYSDGYNGAVQSSPVNPPPMQPDAPLWGQEEGTTFASALQQTIDSQVIEPPIVSPVDTNPQQQSLNSLTTAIDTSSTALSNFNAQTIDTSEIGAVDGLSASYTSLATSIDTAGISYSDFGTASANALSGLDNAALPVDDAQNFNSSISDAAVTTTSDLAPALSELTTPIGVAGQMMQDYFDREYNVKVNITTNQPGLWTGGPVAAGMKYTVNEKGQEGFLNKFGNISPIRKPSFGTWKAPGDGYVIPANIYSNLNTASAIDVPSTTVNPVSIKQQSTKGPDPSTLIRAMMHIVSQINANNNSELAKTQAYQAKQIGNLGSAIDELVRKQWNVDVKIKNTTNPGYYRALTHRM